MTGACNQSGHGRPDADAHHERLETPGLHWKRVGRPRLGWVRENCIWTNENTLSKEWKFEDEDDCISYIREQAKERRY